MPFDHHAFRFRFAFAVAVVACAIAAALVALPTQAAPNNGADAAAAEPIAGFQHIGDQKVELTQATTLAGARVTTLPNGGFSVAAPDVAAPAGSARAVGDDLSAIGFSAATGVASFDLGAFGSVRVTPVDRTAPTTVQRDASSVIADDVAPGIDEVTLASSTELEQHFIVSHDALQAAGGALSREYRLALPDGLDAAMSDGELQIAAAGQVLLRIRADYAVDESGTHFGVSLGYDDETSTFDVDFDAGGRRVEGSLAIDPQFLNTATDGQYLLQTCQAGAVALVCGAANDTIPNVYDGQGTATFNVASSPNAGLYVGTASNVSYGTGD